MFKMSEIKELIKLLDQSNIHELEIESEGSKIAIRKPNRTETVMVSAPAHAMFPPAAPAPIAINAAPVAPATAAIPAPVAATPAAEVVDANVHKITSPMVGTFYRAPAPTSPNFVEKGASVTAKSVVCIVEAMKLMNEIEAEVDGEIIDVLVENGQLVEFGQPLFLVRKK